MTKAKVWSDMGADERAEAVLDRISEAEEDGTARNLAWKLEDGRFLVLRLCDAGYAAYVLGRDYRDDSPAAVVPCRAMACPDEVLLEHAAKSINEGTGGKPVDAAGAQPADYNEVAKQEAEVCAEGSEPEAA
ncbi:MAG: hypothetical protein LUG27_05395 [Clostridiales bacterium]|nr:hypothetical protein [Clostridiales bacterium]